jgi:tetratricopeptide (TPR) repeat protein
VRFAEGACEQNVRGIFVRKSMKTMACGLLVCGLFAPVIAHANEGVVPYGDIGKHWAKAAIIRGVEAGLFAAGSGTVRFYPEREMTRAEFLALVDRLYEQGQLHLYPLTFLSEHGEYGQGEGFDEPYLPYADVDRLTWMYDPILRVSVLLDRLYGPGAIQQVFPGKELHPNQPITREEAAKLLQMYTMGTDGEQAWQNITAAGWMDGRPEDKLKRGEAAVVADRLLKSMQGNMLLPLLDYDGQKFPTVPEIRELFPLFVTYTNQMTKDEETFVHAVEAIRNHEDSEKTFGDLKRLAESPFDNRIGVHYYLSWDPGTPLSENLDQAFSAIDAYFADKVILPNTLRLLCANVYDIALQMGAEDPSMYGRVLERLGSYEQKVRQGSEEWQSLAIYLAALEAKSGKTEEALVRYRSFADKKPEALLNAVYYLVEANRLDEAETWLASPEISEAKGEVKQLARLLSQELAVLKQQPSLVTDLTHTLKLMDNKDGYTVHGESVLRGFLMKYTQEVDQRDQIGHTFGIFQSPQQLVLDKWESYTDGRKNVQYERDFERGTWEKSSIKEPEFLHEWVDGMSIAERARTLHARYYKQSFGRYEIITEWIPGPALAERAKHRSFGAGAVKQIPVYMTKYYIDRDTDLLVQRVWRYEEIYDTKEYVAYAGKETYEFPYEVHVRIPDEAVKGASR